ncbi:hypothetical protein HK102_007565 [Quaeritorhiza haematococci]|nr:hypothetical protein HK102_007565 [Quaeritorhiza haematococci]
MVSLLNAILFLSGAAGLVGLPTVQAASLAKRQQDPVDFYVHLADDNRGDSVQLWPGQDCQNLPWEWNDRVTHAYVNYCVTVYEHSNCQGRFKTFCGKERHDLGDMRGAVSSLNNLNFYDAVEQRRTEECVNNCPSDRTCHMQCPNWMQCQIESGPYRLLCQGVPGKVFSTVCTKVAQEVAVPSCWSQCHCVKKKLWRVAGGHNETEIVGADDLDSKNGTEIEIVSE